MSLGDRIAMLMDEQDVSQAELARRVGLSQPTIHALIKGGSQGSKHLHKIARALNTSTHFLAGETDDPAANAVPVPTPQSIADQLDLTLVPQLELGYSMGGGSVFNDYRHTGFRAFDRGWLKSIARGAFSDLFVARGEGDSMQPTLMDEDMVLIDTSQKFIHQQDRIWAISYGDLGMIKRVRRLATGAYRIISDNQNIKPFDVVDEEMHVVGRVVWIGRRI